MGLKKLILQMPSGAISEGEVSMKGDENTKYEIVPVSRYVSKIFKEKMPELKNYKIYVRRPVLC